MPRGNDTEGNAVQAAAMRNQYGIHANADELIRAGQAGVDPAVQKALLLGVDEEATSELRKEEGLSGVAGKFDLAEGEEVLDFAVRGNALVAVVEDEAGNVRKVVTGFTDDYKEPKLTEEQEATRAAANRDARIASETARLRAEADARIEEAREQENQRVAEELAKIREQADEELQKAQEQAQEDDGSSTDASGADASGTAASGEASSEEKTTSSRSRAKGGQTT